MWMRKLQLTNNHPPHIHPYPGVIIPIDTSEKSQSVVISFYNRHTHKLELKNIDVFFNNTYCIYFMQYRYESIADYLFLISGVIGGRFNIIIS